MGERMDDGTTELEQAPAQGERFVIVPTLDAWRELLERVRDLEARGTPPAREYVATLAGGDSARLDRHRAELEALKRWANDVIGLLEPYFPGAVPAVPKGDEYL